MLPLSKPDKKVARALIDKALELKRRELLAKTQAVLTKWDSHEADTYTSYMDLFDAVQKADKEIAYWFDGLGGSDYFDRVMAFRRMNWLTDEDLAAFSPERQAHIVELKKIWTDFHRK